jgi:pimeloyl-ACP methyl ester carboxylesterase
MATFVLVPGAWLGGWCWEGVAQRLCAAGHDVRPVTLAGVAERANELGPQINLAAHTHDVLTAISPGTQAVVVGHSCGAAVVQAATSVAPDQISLMVFLDAPILEAGQSVLDTLPPSMLTALLTSVVIERGTETVAPDDPASWSGIGPDQAARIRPLLTSHPLRPLVEPSPDPNADVLKAYVRTCQTISAYADGLQRAQANGWPAIDLGGGHYAMLTNPAAVATALLALV